MKGSERKQLRAIGHHLKPVILIGSGGLSEGLLHEAGRAITDHELIKVKLNVGDREVRAALAKELAESLGAELLQTLGTTVLLFRKNPKPDPRLSNLLRPVGE